jgi:hypothetical protein
MSEESLDRREVLMQAMEAAEEGTLEPVEEAPAELEVVDEIAEEVEIEAAQEEEIEEAPEEPALQRPSTWKKEYLPIWDKLTQGEQLTKEEAIKLAQYSNQRESEYKKGVSTYKAEADRAKPFVEVIAPIEQDLVKRGINPTQYVQNLVRAEQILSNAPYQQKVQIFQQLAAW